MSVAIADYYNGFVYLISDVQLSVPREPDYDALAYQPNQFRSDYWKRSVYTSKLLILSPTIAAQWAGTHFLAKSITRNLQRIIEQGHDFYPNAKAILSDYEHEDIDYIVHAALDGQWRIALTSAMALNTSRGTTYVIGSGTDEMIKILKPLANRELDQDFKALHVLAKANHYELRYIDFHRELVGGAFEIALYEETGWKKFGYSYWDHDILGEGCRSLGGPRLSGYKDGTLYIGDIKEPGKRSENWIVPGGVSMGVQQDHFPCVVRPTFHVHCFSGSTEGHSDGLYPTYVSLHGTSEDYFVNYSIRDDGLCTLICSREYLQSINKDAAAARDYFENSASGEPGRL